MVTSFGSPDFKSVASVSRSLGDDCSLIPVVHCTGRRLPFFDQMEKLLQRSRRRFIFLHVSLSYFRTMGRIEELKKIESIHKELGAIVLCPSQTVASSYRNAGIDATTVQLGIEEPIATVAQKNGWIVTACTSDSKLYQYIKGVPEFIQLVHRLGVAERAAIIGLENKVDSKIKRFRFSHSSCIDFLAGCTAYLQLSRSEAYNLTAVEAKRLGIPVIVSNIEGHKDNVRHGFRADSISDAADMLDKVLNRGPGLVCRSVEANKVDSCCRESLSNFRSQFYDKAT